MEKEEIQVKKVEKMKGETRAELRGMYAVWLREVKRYLRDRSRIITAVTSPLVWLVLFGVGFASFTQQAGGINYVGYIFPGIVAQSLLFTSVFLGISVIYDRQFGFLKEMLIAPIRRIMVFSGKMFGGATDALFQGSIVLILSFLFGVSIGIPVILACLPVMLLTAVSFVSMSIIIASRMRSFESFGLIVNLVNLPLFFSSGAIFPVNTTPPLIQVLLVVAIAPYNPISTAPLWLQVLNAINSNTPLWFQILNTLNPLTYAVDALRGLILGNTIVSFNISTLLPSIFNSLLNGNHVHPLWLDLSVLGVFAVAMLLLGAFSFRTRK